MLNHAISQMSLKNETTDQKLRIEKILTIRNPDILDGLLTRAKF